jgi:hypothetical protein
MGSASVGQTIDSRVQELAIQQGSHGTIGLSAGVVKTGTNMLDEPYDGTPTSYGVHGAPANSTSLQSTARRREGDQQLRRRRMR